MNSAKTSTSWGLIGWAAGGTLGVLEAAVLQNPISWWSRDADRSIYFLAFLSYALIGWIVLRLLQVVLRTGFARSISRAVAVAGVVILAVSAIYAFVPGYRLSTRNSALAKPGTPNILLITLDTTRADHLGCYGYSQATSPFLDSLARKGVLFEQAYTTSTWTLPSHASLFTGMMPTVHGAGYKNFFLSPSLQTLAEYLGSNGYTSAGFIGGPFLVSAFNIHQGFEYYDEELDQHSKLKRLFLFRAIESLLRLPLWVTDGQRRAGEINQKVFPYIDFLENRGPFFLFINYFDPHEPYDPPEVARKQMNVQASITGHIRQYFIDKQTGVALHRDQTPMTDDEFRQLRSLYDAEIRYLDMELSKLWSKLESAGLLENTIAVITSDHGESLGERNLLDHGHTLYQEQVRVPLIIVGPGAWGRSARISAPVQTTDVFATLLHAAGGKQEGIQGRDLIPILTEPGTSTRVLLAELDEDPHPRFKAFRRSLRMILKGEDKLIEASNQKHEFYDIAMDPGEIKNTIEANSGVAAALRKEMNDHFRLFVAMRHEGKGEIDAETREKLKALGYIE